MHRVPHTAYDLSTNPFPPHTTGCAINRAHATLSAEVPLHEDPGDAPPGAIVSWGHDKSTEEVDGGFYMTNWLLSIRPVGLVVLHLASHEITHGSKAPSNGGSRLGMALCNNVSDLSRVEKLLTQDVVTWVEEEEA